jgi:hypothetical protein
MTGGTLYSKKPDTKWYRNMHQTQDKFRPFGTKLIQIKQFQNDNVLCLYHSCGKKDQNFPLKKVNADFASILRDVEWESTQLKYDEQVMR